MAIKPWLPPLFQGMTTKPRNWPKAKKLSSTDVLEIREDYAKGSLTMAELGRQYGVSTSTILHVVKRESWKQVPMSPDLEEKIRIARAKKKQCTNYNGAKVTEADVRELRRLGQTQKYTHKQLAKKFGIGKSTASSILNRTTWKHE